MITKEPYLLHGWGVVWILVTCIVLWFVFSYLRCDSSDDSDIEEEEEEEGFAASRQHPIGATIRILYSKQTPGGYKNYKECDVFDVGERGGKIGEEEIKLAMLDSHPSYAEISSLYDYPKILLERRRTYLNSNKRSPEQDREFRDISTVLGSVVMKGPNQTQRPAKRFIPNMRLSPIGKYTVLNPNPSNKLLRSAQTGNSFSWKCYPDTKSTVSNPLKMKGNSGDYQYYDLNTTGVLKNNNGEYYENADLKSAFRKNSVLQGTGDLLKFRVLISKSTDGKTDTFKIVQDGFYYYDTSKLQLVQRAYNNDDVKKFMSVGGAKGFKDLNGSCMRLRIHPNGMVTNKWQSPPFTLLSSGNTKGLKPANYDPSNLEQVIQAKKDMLTSATDPANSSENLKNAYTQDITTSTRGTLNIYKLVKFSTVTNKKTEGTHAFDLYFAPSQGSLQVTDFKKAIDDMFNPVIENIFKKQIVGIYPTRTNNKGEATGPVEIKTKVIGTDKNKQNVSEYRMYIPRQDPSSGKPYEYILKFTGVDYTNYTSSWNVYHANEVYNAGKVVSRSSVSKMSRSEDIWRATMVFSLPITTNKLKHRTINTKWRNHKVLENPRADDYTDTTWYWHETYTAEPRLVNGQLYKITDLPGVNASGTYLMKDNTLSLMNNKQAALTINKNPVATTISAKDYQKMKIEGFQDIKVSNKAAAFNWTVGVEGSPNDLSKISDEELRKQGYGKNGKSPREDAATTYCAAEGSTVNVDDATGKFFYCNGFKASDTPLKSPPGSLSGCKRDTGDEARCLDRTYADCGKGKGINSLGFKVDGNNYLSYQGSCVDIKSHYGYVGGRYDVTDYDPNLYPVRWTNGGTGAATWAWGKLADSPSIPTTTKDISDMSIECPKNSVLSGVDFQVTNTKKTVLGIERYSDTYGSRGQFPPSDQIHFDKFKSYTYTCTKSKEPLTCSQKSTPKENYGTVPKFSNLATQKAQMKCPAGEALNQFKLNNNGDGTFQYNYTCCKPSEFIEPFAASDPSDASDPRDTVEPFAASDPRDTIEPFARGKFTCGSLPPERRIPVNRQFPPWSDINIAQQDTCDSEPNSCWDQTKPGTAWCYKLPYDSPQPQYNCKTAPASERIPANWNAPDWPPWNTSWSYDTNVLVQARHCASKVPNSCFDSSPGYGKHWCYTVRGRDGQPPQEAKTPEPAPAPAPAPSYSPFTAGSQTATAGNEWANGNIIYLERHNADCGSKPINQLRLNRPADNQIQWQYTCANGGELGTPVNKSTPANESGNGNTIYLERHDADCGTNNVLTKLRLNIPADNQMQWQYACAPNKQSKELTCRDVTTISNDNGGGNSIYLDRHNIKCEPNEALSRVRLNITDDKNYQFQYRCCS